MKKLLSHLYELGMAMPVRKNATATLSHHSDRVSQEGLKSKKSLCPKSKVAVSDSVSEGRYRAASLDR